MAGVVIAVETTLKTYQCGQCGGVYAIGESYAEKKREKGGFWTCPYCQCSWGYPADGTENEKLRRQVAQLTSKIDQKDAEVRNVQAEHEHTRHRLRGTKAALTRTKNAVAAGKCPCCHVEFPDLTAHMKDTHPDYHQADEQEEATA